MAERLLTEKRFEKLVAELRQLLGDASHAASVEKTQGFWQVGKRICAERLLQEAGYHNSVLSDLARAVGVSVRSLQRSVRFYQA